MEPDPTPGGVTPTRFSRAPLRRGLFCSSGWRRSRHIAFMPIRLGDREKGALDETVSVLADFAEYSRSPCDHPVAESSWPASGPTRNRTQAELSNPAGASPDACRPQGADPRPRTRGLHHAGATDRRRYGFCLEQGIHIIGNFLKAQQFAAAKTRGARGCGFEHVHRRAHHARRSRMVGGGLGKRGRFMPSTCTEVNA